MAKVWKVACWRNGPGASGNAAGEFSRLSDAVDFARRWIDAGWSGTITNPDGQAVELEKGKPVRFPRRKIRDRSAEKA